MTDDQPDLKQAYSLKTPEDSIRLYRDWATTYDQTFARDMDYVYPGLVAGIFAERAGDDDGPVLDVGAGTGLVGEALVPLGAWAVDGLDISGEMLAVAAGKQRYRNLVQADLSKPLALETGVYGGVVSSGTFTHGHVGPDALDELLRIARSGALFALGINGQIYEANGFREKFEQLAPGLLQFEICECQIYGQGADPDHRNDRALVAVFRKA